MLLPPATERCSRRSTLIESVWSSIEALEVSGCVGIGDDGGANGGAEGDFKSEKSRSGTQPAMLLEQRAG